MPPRRTIASWEAERLARMVRRLAEVGAAGLRAEVRPELLDDGVARQAVAVGEREQRHELLRASARATSPSATQRSSTTDRQLSEDVDAGLRRHGRSDRLVSAAATQGLRPVSSTRTCAS
jgi:hypothetical protein